MEQDYNTSVLPKHVAEALLGVHERSGVPLADRPSVKDIQLLKDLYGNHSVNVNNELNPVSHCMIMPTRKTNPKLHHHGTAFSARNIATAQVCEQNNE